MKVREVTPLYMENALTNKKYNRDVIENYSKLAAVAIVTKACNLNAMRNRRKRLINCNRYWRMEVYEISKVKRLLQTYLCRDKFCYNCSRLKQHVLKTRYLPLMEPYKDQLYHMTFTVPSCTGEKLRDTIYHMGRCFKTLIDYLNGNRTIKGLDLSQCGYSGCIRTLEITGDYHPHFHAAMVFDNPIVAEDKYINNRFSQSGNYLFTDFEAMIQRIWYMLLNGQRLTYEAIYSDSTDNDRYGCQIDKFNPDDYKKLFGYISKTRPDNMTMSFKDFRTIYHALDGTRQIQGYGIFYRKPIDDLNFTDDDCALLADLILPDEEPIMAHEFLDRLVKDKSYTFVKSQYSRQKDIIN